MPRKKGGGKLNRSEIIQARLDPKLHMAAEIMARSERRTLSSFIEYTIEQKAKSFKVKRNLFHPWWSEDPDLYSEDKIYSKSDYVTVEQAIQDIGSGHESIRFFKFAMYFPELLNQEEEELFTKIIMTNYFWTYYQVDIEDQEGEVLKKTWVRQDTFEGLVQENLREYWEKLKKSQINIELLSELPKGKKINIPPKESPSAIKKIVKTNNPAKPYKTIFMAEDLERYFSFHENFLDKDFIKNIFINVNNKKFEFKKTLSGPKMISTFDLSNKEFDSFFELYNLKIIKEQNNGN